MIDRANRVVARSRQHEAFVGKAAPDEFLSVAREADGIWEGYNLEGTAVLGAYARSGVSGWTAFVGVPTEIVQAPLHKFLWTLLGLGAVLTLLSLLLARSFGQRIAAPVQSLINGAAPCTKRAVVRATHRTCRDRSSRRCAGLRFDETT